MRQMQGRARRPRWHPGRGDKPPLTPLERSERLRRSREIADRLPAGETLAVLAEEYRASPQTIMIAVSREGVRCEFLRSRGRFSAGGSGLALLCASGTTGVKLEALSAVGG